ncbi:MAG: riboflavin biosynthesis protein RibF [Clostridia bacterium]|nr:riboflavin biosynthesis protein RibF [Clostridia bacterium]
MGVNHVIAIGDFDGVHLGHREILTQLNTWAQTLGAEALVLSFDSNTKGRRLISEENVKEFYFRQYGIDKWCLLSFEEWRDVSAEEFTEQFLKKELNTVGLVCGKDFRFGKDRAGNEFTLISRGIAVKKLEHVTAEDVRISSTAIRGYLEKGDLERAEQRLGHPFCLMGKVCHGKGLARQFGLPTVNLEISERQLLPPRGVYAAWVEVNGVRYPAAANIGVRPTVEDEGRLNLEAHLLGEVPDLYDREIRVELKSYLRREMKFENKEALFLQIQKDGEQSKKRLEMLK